MPPSPPTKNSFFGTFLQKYFWVGGAEIKAGKKVKKAFCAKNETK